MSSRQQRRQSARQAQAPVAKNQHLTASQIEQLRLILQPLVTQWTMSRGVVAGFLAASGITDTRFSIDIETGIVALASENPAGPPLGSLDGVKEGGSRDGSPLEKGADTDPSGFFLGFQPEGPWEQRADA